MYYQCTKLQCPLLSEVTMSMYTLVKHGSLTENDQIESSCHMSLVCNFPVRARAVKLWLPFVFSF